jgi:hypothetical protein
MGAGDPVLYSVYVYAPNKIAPVIFAVAYAISTVFHVWQCYRYKAFKLVGLHSVCGVLFVLGYCLRAVGAHNYIYDPDDSMPLLLFIFSQVFIYVCPPLLELSNYHVLGRVFYYVPYCSPFRPGRVLATFGGIMIIVEALNALGVSLAVNSGSSPQVQALGGHLTIAAISIQLFVILSFGYLSGLFHRRCSTTKLHSKKVNSVLYTLYASMALIFARCIYRLVEHMEPTKKELDNLESLKELSPILRYESFFYIFEATLMLVNSILWNVWHPGRFLPSTHNICLQLDGNEVEIAEEPDERPLLAKTANIFTFGVLYRRKRQTTDFQQLVNLGETGGSQTK